METPVFVCSGHQEPRPGLLRHIQVQRETYPIAIIIRSGQQSLTATFMANSIAEIETTALQIGQRCKIIAFQYSTIGPK
jgi:hypothetical protein